MFYVVMFTTRWIPSMWLFCCCCWVCTAKAPEWLWLLIFRYYFFVNTKVSAWNGAWSYERLELWRVDSSNMVHRGKTTWCIGEERVIFVSLAHVVVKLVCKRIIMRIVRQLLRADKCCGRQVSMRNRFDLQNKCCEIELNWIFRTFGYWAFSAIKSGSFSLC